jgi:hypothetical protein
LILRTTGLAVLKNDAGLPVLQNMSNKQIKGSIGGRYEDEFAPKDRKSCGVRVSNYIFSGDVH